MSTTRKPARSPAPATVLQLRENLILAARPLAAAQRPSWAGEAVVTILVRPHVEANAAVRWPSARE